MGKDKLLSVCDKILAFSVYALIYFLPISTALIEIFASILVVTFFVKRGIVFYYKIKDLSASQKVSLIKCFFVFLESLKPVSTFLSIPMSVFILVNFLSIFVSQYPLVSISGFFCKLLQGCFSYFIFVECINTPKRLKNFSLAFFFSAMLAGINGIFQKIYGTGFVRGYSVPRDGRISSSFKHPNDFGSYLIVAGILLLSFLIFFIVLKIEKKKLVASNGFVSRIFSAPVQFLILIVFTLLITCLGFTFSRGAWLGCFLAMLCFALYRKRNLLISFVVAAVFLFIFNPLLQSSRNVSFITDSYVEDQRKLKSEELKLAASLKADKKEISTGMVGSKRTPKKNSLVAFLSIGTGRRNFWKDSIGIIKDYPVLGTGFNTFSRVSVKYGIEAGFYPHNCYIHMACETGVLGLFSFLGIIFALYFNSLKNLKFINDRFCLAIIVGGMAGMAGFLAHCFVDTSMYSIQLNQFMWLMFGMIVAAGRIALKDTKS